MFGGQVVSDCVHVLRLRTGYRGVYLAGTFRSKEMNTVIIKL